KLQDKVRHIPTPIIKKQLEAEFKKPVSELFLSFSERPIATASLSQVHKAVLKTGEIVAVKVRKPEVSEIVEKDIAILYELVNLIEARWISSKKYNPKDFVDEFAITIREELDFSLEARNAEKFAANFKTSKIVKIPKVYGEFTKEDVLVTEFISGIKINQKKKLESENFDKHLVASNGTDMALKQIFEDGFFHGDLHPGNIFVLEGNVVALVDFGMVGRIDRETMDELADVLLSLTKFNTDGIIRGLEKMEIVAADTDTKKIKREISKLIGRYYGLELKNLEIGKILTDVLEIIRKNDIRIPSDFALLFKTLITAEGTARDLDPEFNMVEHIQPFVKKLLSKKYAPREIVGQGVSIAQEVFEGLKNLPRNMDWLFRSIKQGKLFIGLEHRGLDRLDATIDRSSNRVSFSLIISSLIIGSSLIISVDKGPSIFGYPVLGITGFLFATILGVGLVISIIRGGRF
ncbi:MAG: AarF/UbiB family protein, partial [Candidatus Pacebacteria bacterium]|nr:AarF/UbiB family protein [Candidatus Paceibacterota bacterium]